MSLHSGRHFLQLPGPTNVPDRILRAMDRPVIDHRGPEFGELALRILKGLQEVFRCSGPVLVFPASASGGWESALVNTLAPGDRVVAFENGFFSAKWARLARELGLEVQSVRGDWRRPVDPDVVESTLRGDRGHGIRAVLVVHNETSTGVTSDVEAIRGAVDSVGHPALFMVDAVSSLGSMDVRHGDWGVDVTVCGSQKGLMLPPGLGFTALSQTALDAAERRRSDGPIPHSYFGWQRMLEMNADGYFPYTPATSLLFGLDEALSMLREEGLENIFARHDRHAGATREAVSAWGLETVCQDADAHSSSVTSVLVPDGADADRLRAVILERFQMSLGNGLGELEGRAFRIGHLGDFNDLMLMGTLSGVEMGLRAAGVEHRPGGAQAALEWLSGVGA